MSVTPSPGLKPFATQKGQRGWLARGALRKKGASPPPVSKAPFPCPFPFLFDLLRIPGGGSPVPGPCQDQGAFIAILHLSTLLEARGGGPGWQVPAGRLGPRSCSWPYLGTGEGAAGPGRRQGSRALGWGHVHLPGKDVLSRARCFRSGIPALGPAVTSPGPGVPGSLWEPRGGAGWAPRTLPRLFSCALPLSTEQRKNLRLGRRSSW